jgi:hypothetical protein
LLFLNLKKNVTGNNIAEKDVNIIMGTGGVSSDINGPAIAHDFANVLQRPNAVPEKIGGNIVAVPI